MRSDKKRVFCAVFAAVFLSGCSAGSDAPEISVADFGSSGGVNYSGQTMPSGEAAPSVGAVSQEYTPAVTSPLTQPNPSASSSEQPEEPYTSSAVTAGGSSTVTTAATAAAETTSAPQSTSSAAIQSSAASSSERTTQSSASAEGPDFPDEPDEPVEPNNPDEPDYDFGTSAYTALNYQEIKGVWISYIELSELLQGQSRDSFRGNIAEVFDNCVSLGINTVYVHVRSHSDAYYKSELFPWSKYVTGTAGADPGFDPLEIMLDEAHSRGLSFQAWINPLRGCGVSQLSAYEGYPFYTFAAGAGMAGKYAVDVNGIYFLNPAYDEVTELIAAGASEIAAKYDVDGLHIDDYFYPTTDASFDSGAFSGSGYSDLSEFRFDNCDRMVSELYAAVKETNPTAVFTVSVQGRIDNNYTQLYADVRKWCTSSGYLDVIIPQIYYGFDNSAAPYQATLNEWDALAAKGGIPLVAGLSVSKAGAEDTWAGEGKYEWVNNSDILARQLFAAKETRSYGGFALYSYRSIFSPEASVSAAVEKEISALKDII